MRISVRHEFTIDAGQGSVHAVQHLLLMPQSGPGQTVLDWAIEMEGIDKAARFVDAFGNMATLVSQARVTEPLAILVRGEVETIDRNGVLGWIEGEPVPAVFRRITDLTEPNREITDGLEPGSSGRIALLHALMARAMAVLDETGQSQSNGEQTRNAGLASSADLAHAFIGAARAFDIPARFVSGYLAGGDRLHAWAEAFDEGLGWIGFDPSLQLCPSDRHVRVAVGLDAESTRPVRSVPSFGEDRTLAVEVAMVAQ